MNTKEYYDKFRQMVERDKPWIIITLLLFALLTYVTNIAMNQERTCDERYANFVVTCYEATGILPSGAYNLSRLNLTNRDNGERWTTTIDTRGNP